MSVFLISTLGYQLELLLPLLEFLLERYQLVLLRLDDSAELN